MSWRQIGDVARDIAERLRQEVAAAATLEDACAAIDIFDFARLPDKECTALFLELADMLGEKQR